MLITGKLHSARRYRSFRDTSFASTFVRGRKVRGGERGGREEGWSRGWRVDPHEGGNGREKREKSAPRKSGIQWPVSSREGTYVMPDVNAGEREKKRDGGGPREEQPGDPKPHELRGGWTMEQRYTATPPYLRYPFNPPRLPFPSRCAACPCLTGYILNVCKTLVIYT